MEPAIGRSIKKGFQATNRSWAGMGLFAAGWLVLGLLTFGLVSLTDVPPELLEAAAPQEQTALTIEQEQTLRQQLDEQSRLALEWLGRAWLVLGILSLVALTASVFLVAGQIGYLTSRVRGEPTPVSTFWVSARRAFKPLLLSWLLVLAISIGFMLILLLVGLLLSVIPPILAGVLGFVFVIALIVGLIWISVRIAFWSVAIVTGGLGPIAALRMSFHTTHRRWWRTLGLLLLLVLISLSLALPINLLGWIGGLIGGVGTVVLDFLRGLLEFAIINLYLGFVAMASLIRFYLDVSSSTEGNPEQSAT